MICSGETPIIGEPETVHWSLEVNEGVSTLKVGAPTLKVGESMVYNMAAEGKVVVSMLGLTDDQSEQPAILPFASVRINRRSTPPAPKLAVDAATV